jgi:hypothetical protein
MAKLKNNSLSLYIGDTIKIGRKSLKILKGDYILDNGACYQFIAGDRRVLYYTKNGRFNDRHTIIMLPKKLVKAIDFSVLSFTGKNPKDSNTMFGLKYYFFKTL